MNSATALAFVFVLTIHQANAQCKYQRNEVDPFTKREVVQTKWERLFSNLGTAVNVYGARVDSFHYLTVGLNMLDVFSVDEDAKLMFILDNDSVVTLKALEWVVADYSTTGSITTWYGSVDYYVPDSLLILLTSHTVKKLRLYMTDGYFEKEVTESNAAAIKDVLPCVLKQ